MVSPSMLKPIIDDQYTAARAYFLCVIGMLFVESMLHAPSHLLYFYRKGTLLVITRIYYPLGVQSHILFL